jgi:hypothetical protein
MQFLYIYLIIFFGLLLGFLVLLLGKTIVYMNTLLHGPPFVPSSDKAVEQMLSITNLKKTDKIADLGSGDGKILIALAKKGFKTDGFEINPLLIKKTKNKINKLKLNSKARVFHKNIFKINLSYYNVIMIYGNDRYLIKLEKKMKKEMKKNSIIISNNFKFPNWKPIKEKNNIRVYRV